MRLQRPGCPAGRGNNSNRTFQCSILFLRGGQNEQAAVFVDLRLPSVLDESIEAYSSLQESVSVSSHSGIMGGCFPAALSSGWKPRSLNSRLMMSLQKADMSLIPADSVGDFVISHSASVTRITTTRMVHVTSYSRIEYCVWAGISRHMGRWTGARRSRVQFQAK